jgi:hypothetical protein
MTQWTVKWFKDSQGHLFIKARSTNDKHKIDMNAPILGWIIDTSCIVPSKVNLASQKQQNAWGKV